MQQLVAFAQKQDFGTGCHVVPSDWFRVVCDVAIGFFGQVSKIFFMVRACEKRPHIEISSQMSY